MVLINLYQRNQETGKKFKDWISDTDHSGCRHKRTPIKDNEWDKKDIYLIIDRNVQDKKRTHKFY